MLTKNIVLCRGIRTPIGHLAKSLSAVSSESLLALAIEAVVDQCDLDENLVDGVIAGWVGQGSHAPNIARTAALRAGLPEKVHAITLQCNCVSGMEAVSDAARRIIVGEGDLFIAGGTESMSKIPFAIRCKQGRAYKSFRSRDSLGKNWELLPDDPNIAIHDCIEEGLIDPITHINMAETAEICAQKYGITRNDQDTYTLTTFERCMNAEERGFYKQQIVPVMNKGTVVLDHDEYVYLRKAFITKPALLKKAPVLFQSSVYHFKSFYDKFASYLDNKQFDDGQTKPSVTLFNSCARSDAAAVVIVTTEERAKELGLDIYARLVSWGYTGFRPELMGISPGVATPVALKNAGITFDQLDTIELHEAFAATVLATFKTGFDAYGHRWREMWEEGRLNPNGGSIPLGHPLAATGTRLLLNLIYTLKESDSARYGLAAACASGGIGGAMILERY